MPIYNGKTAINMNKQQLLQHLQKGWVDPYGSQYNKAIEDDPIQSAKNFAINTTNRKPQQSPIEAELKRDMRRLMFVCIMNLLLIIGSLIAFAVVATRHL